MKHPLDRILHQLPWLREPELEVCVVGSSALSVACARHGLEAPPIPHDLDFAWRLSLADGAAYLRERGVEFAQTQGAESRGTLGVRFGSDRVELTSFRGGGTTPKERIANDAALRDMTIGAVLWRIHDDTVHDPHGGLDDWARGRIRACGDALDRIREHPIRALRYMRKAAELGFVVEEKTRKVIRQHGGSFVDAMLPEAITEELRRVLEIDSPGLFFALCSEENLLGSLIPELDILFDGRRAGRLRWHPEVSQGLHTILTMRVAATLADRDKLDAIARRKLMLGVLFHDLGKGATPEDELPSHPGHEAAGVALIDDVFGRLPGLGDKRCRKFCRVVALRHLDFVKLRDLRAGTLVEVWERDLVPLRGDFALLAAAVRADREGRLRPEEIGFKTREPDFDAGAFERRVHSDLDELDRILSSVSGRDAAERFPDDKDKLRSALHEQRCKRLHESGFRIRDRS